MSELRYPIGVQDFEKIRTQGKVYVDKTKLIHELVQNDYIFLSRPRRFGKSLLISTIQAYFEGKKELFEGLEISQLEKEWKTYPVLKLELSRYNPSSPDSLNSILQRSFNEWEEKYGIANTDYEFSQRFENIIKAAYNSSGNKVVILVDEYDNPLINTLHKEDINEKNRNLLKSIYSNLKDLDGYIRFGMLTGVSRFSKMTIFSGLNNLMDISLSNNFSSICGFTEDEIRKYLWQGVENIGRKRNCSAHEALSILKKNYDGYHFSEECPDIYNPFSLLNTFKEGRISYYWFETATPKFLIRKLRETSRPFVEIFHDKVGERSLKATDASFSSPVSLLYQTGYLTIKDFDPETGKFQLGIPNKEVRDAIYTTLLSNFTGRDEDSSGDLSRQIVEPLKDGDAKKFLEDLKIFLSGVPYNVIPERNRELYYQNVLYLMFSFAGLQVETERPNSFGRSDLIVKTDKYIYIFELKVDRSAEEALRQIEEKQYALPYSKDGKTIIKVGLNFLSKTRNLGDYLLSVCK